MPSTNSVNIDFVVRNGLVVNTNLLYANNGKVGINTSSPSANLDVVGTANVSGNVYVGGLGRFNGTLTSTGAANVGGALVVSTSGDFGSYINAAGNGVIGGTMSITGATSVANTISVTGNATFSNTVRITGNTAISNTISVTGNASFSNTMSVVGAATFTNTMNITGALVVANNISGTGTGAFSGAVYGTQFIDADDNSWYVNPNSTSRLNGLTLNVGTWITSTDTYSRLQFASAGATYLMGSNTSEYWIRFGTQDNATRAIFEGAGNFYTTGNVTAYWSDKRLKKNIVKISDWKEIINGIGGYRYEWNDIGKKLTEEDGIQVGLIAQEVKQALPQAAAVQMLQYTDKGVPRKDIDHDPKDPYLTVREEKLIPVLVEAIKGLMEEIEYLKKKIG